MRTLTPPAHPSGEVPLGPAVPPPRRTVLIAGGGIAGLTVAHELSRYPTFDITVVEQNEHFGGKARSLRSQSGHPSEHAMRVLLASYTCLFQIMSEVRNGDGSTLMDNLVYPVFSFKHQNREHILPAHYTSRLTFMRHAFALMGFFIKCGVSIGELALFLYRVGRILWSTPSQVNARMGRVSFEEYLDAPERSAAFRTTLLRISEMLVAAKRTASASVISRLILEWFVGPFLDTKFERQGFACLDGPTSERLIDPWVEDLKRKGVKFRNNTRIELIAEHAREITHLQTATGEILTADIFCLCLPHNGLDALIRGRIADFVPTIANLTPFGEEWSAGIQYYVRELPENLIGRAGRIVVDVSSPWSIVYMIHAEGRPWRNVPLPPGTAAVLSLVMSNGRNCGQTITTKPFVRCTPREMKDEALAQIGLYDAFKDAPFAIGPDLEHIPIEVFDANPRQFSGMGASKVDAQTVLVSDGLLYIRTPANLDQEPANFTDIFNLFIAGEFTRTNFSTPTMEKSCESGMRCALAICESTGLSYDESRLEGADLPFRFLRSPGFHVLARAALVVFAAFLIWAIVRWTK